MAVTLPRCVLRLPDCVDGRGRGRTRQRQGRTRPAHMKQEQRTITSAKCCRLHRRREKERPGSEGKAPPPKERRKGASQDECGWTEKAGASRQDGEMGACTETIDVGKKKQPNSDLPAIWLLSQGFSKRA